MSHDYSKLVIESERLKLISINSTYAEEIFKEFTPEITKYMFPATPKDIEETKEFISQAEVSLENGEEFQAVILNKETEEYLGNCGIHSVQTDTPTLGIWLKKSAHGHGYGYGFEAVEAMKKWVDINLDYDYLIYPVDKANIASKRIPEKLGGVAVSEYKKISGDGRALNIVEYQIKK